MPYATVPLWCEVLLAPTVSPVNLFSLILSTFITNGRAITIDSSCATFQISASVSNSGNIYIGDSTINIGSSPRKGVGAELAAGLGFFDPFAGGGTLGVDIGSYWVIADSASQYLICRCRQK